MTIDNVQFIRSSNCYVSLFQIPLKFQKPSKVFSSTDIIILVVCVCIGASLLSVYFAQHHMINAHFMMARKTFEFYVYIPNALKRELMGTDGYLKTCSIRYEWSRDQICRANQGCYAYFVFIFNKTKKE